MLNKLPLISIILPVYNGEAYLSKAIDSILNQSFLNWELIIVNDCSTDQSLDIAKRYKEIDSRISIVENEINKKLPFSLNAGFLVAQGDYITWTSDDNVLKNNWLNVLLNTLEQTKSDFVFSYYDIIDSDGIKVKEQPVGFVNELLFQNIIGPSFLGKASLFKDNLYDVDLFRIEDYAFWLTNLPFIKCHRVVESLYKYRVHGSSLTTAISSTGGFKHDLVEKMFSRLQLTYNYTKITKEFLILNHLSKQQAAQYLFQNSSILTRNIGKIHNDIYKQSVGSNFKHHIKHYEKLLDYLEITKVFHVKFNILKAYSVNPITLKWFMIYGLKRMKRLIVKKHT